MAWKSLAEIAELFFVDTTPFVDAYFLNPEGQNYDWRGVSPRESYLQTTLKVFKNAHTYIYILTISLSDYSGDHKCQL